MLYQADDGREPILDHRMTSGPEGFVMKDPKTGETMSLSRYMELHPRKESQQPPARNKWIGLRLIESLLYLVRLDHAA